MYGKTSELLTIDGKSVTVYITNSHEYSYNSSGNLAHERISYTQSFQDTYFSYASGKLTSKSVSSNASGVITQVYSETVPLNDQGYDARSRYDAEGIVISRSYVSEKRVESNPIQLVIDDDGRIVKLNYTYDLTRSSLPNPRQFEGLTSRNLLLTASSSGFHCCGPSHSEYRYQFDSQGRVTRRIGLNWKGEFPDSSPVETVYITDYEYECI